MKQTKLVLLVLAGLAAALLVYPVMAQAETVERVSVSSDEQQADGRSSDPSVDYQGDLVAFSSEATDLVEDDDNDVYDVFLRDLVAGTTVLVSVNSDEEQGDKESQSPAISGDGSVVAFASAATNLVGDDTNTEWDVFVRDLLAGITTRVSVSSDEEEGDGPSWAPSVNADGTMVAFESYATNLVDDDTNGAYDVFVRNLVTGTTTRVSVSSDEEEANDHSYSASISGSGRYVAFTSLASNLVEGASGGGSQIYIRDLIDGITSLVSVNGAGEPGNDDSSYASISADGSKVAFGSESTNLVTGGTNSEEGVYLRDLTAGTTERVSVSSAGAEANGYSLEPSLSADGSAVAFISSATNLVAGDTNGDWDVFVRHLNAGTTTCAGVNSSGEPGNDYSMGCSLNADGSVVAFHSAATDLVADDTNNKVDVFVRTFVLAKEATAGSGVARYEQDNNKLLYSGEWAEQEGDEFSKKSLLVTDDPEATLTITFVGTQLDWIATLGPTMGKASVSVDGGEAVLVDLYSDIELLQQVVWSTGVLAYGEHTVTITFPEGDDYVEGKAINVDAFDVYGGYLLQAQSPAGDVNKE